MATEPNQIDVRITFDRPITKQDAELFIGALREEFLTGAVDSLNGPSWGIGDADVTDVVAAMEDEHDEQIPDDAPRDWGEGEGPR